jgi:hypothetical protein
MSASFWAADYERFQEKWTPVFLLGLDPGIGTERPRFSEARQRKPIVNRRCKR